MVTARGIQHLQEDIHDARMRLFHLVKQQRSRFGAFVGRAEKSLFARTRSEQQAERFLRLEFRHVVADELFHSEKFAGENLREFRFADTRGAEK